MKAMLLPSALAAAPYQYLTTFLVNGTVAIDAGSLGLYGSPEEQSRVRHVFLTHAHMDHVASLPIFLENVSDDSVHCPTVYAPAEVLEVVRSDLLNDRVFPDFERLSRAGPPLVKLETLTPGRPVQIADLSVTAVAVDHVVPTFGYVVSDATSAFVFVTDTGPTVAIWELARRTPNLRAVFLEVTFPEDQAWLAVVAKHLTPNLFAGEIRKLPAGVAVYAIHLKARCLDRVRAEIADLNLAQLTILDPGREVTI
ncbi:MAG TPA: 3',5'-cyclic-nucleotide phosphodiesterase [Gemmataceae bacterium]|jgi:ribonuclease BN (tRNA processing enzyme)|nr:3',5'-cyclic-nucleotide phosphodiesterase [Gemmataceae bacterium]